MHRLGTLLIFLLMTSPCFAAGWFHGVSNNYTGPGDINTYTAYYGGRAYTHASSLAGAKLFNVCNSTGGVDVGCADLSASRVSGDLVPATISGITCPGNANCTIKTAYDLTGNGNDVTQATIANRPTFQTQAFGGTRTCMLFNGGQTLTSAQNYVPSFPISVSYVGERTGIDNNQQVLLFFNNGGNQVPQVGWNGGTFFAWAGTYATVPGLVDNIPHSVQTVFAANGTSSTLLVDNTAPTTITTGTGPLSSGNIILSPSGSTDVVTGVICEIGLTNGIDTTSTNSTISINQINWYGFALQPVVTGVSPNNGGIAGGTSTTVTGFNFTGAGSTKFGANASTFSVTDSKHIVATSPAGSGTVDVTVTGPGGTSVTSAADQFTYTSSASYVGPGDVATANGYSYTVWYGARAYSAAKAGQALFNVCVNSDANCANMLSSASTGALVPQTIGGINCPDRLGSCTIKTAYDLTKSTSSGGGAGGIDLTQATISLRPVLMAQAIPTLGVNQACMWYPDQPHYLASSATVSWATSAMTMSIVIINQSGGVRTNNPVYNYSPSGQNYTMTTQAIPLQPGSHFTPNLRGFQADGGNEGVGGQATLYSTIFVDDGTFSVAKAFMLDHAPHTVNAAFNGTSSSIMIDGVPNTGLNAGTTAFPTDTVTMGSTFSNQATQPQGGNIFEGVICEAGFANGDQSAHDAAIDSNQTTYWFTVNATPTTVFDWTANLDGQTAGIQVTLPVMQSIFSDSSVTTWSNSNYVQTSNPSGTQCQNYTGGGGCQPAGTVLISIFGNLPQGGTAGTNAVGLEMQTGDCGFGEAGAGVGQMAIVLNHSAANILVVEADMMFLAAAQAPNGLDFDFHGTIGKTGMGTYFLPPGAANSTSNEPLWTGPGFNGATNQGFASTYDASDGIVQAQPNNSGQSTPSWPSTIGVYNVGVWYHTKFEVATGPNGWNKMSLNSGPGTSLVLFHEYSRGDPARPNNALATTSAVTTSWNFGLAFEPHFGGGQGSPDCALHNSWIAFKNIHATGYLR